LVLDAQRKNRIGPDSRRRTWPPPPAPRDPGRPPRRPVPAPRRPAADFSVARTGPGPGREEGRPPWTRKDVSSPPFSRSACASAPSALPGSAPRYQVEGGHRGPRGNRRL